MEIGVSRAISWMEQWIRCNSGISPPEVEVPPPAILVQSMYTLPSLHTMEDPAPSISLVVQSAYRISCYAGPLSAVYQQYAAAIAIVATILAWQMHTTCVYCYSCYACCACGSCSTYCTAMLRCMHGAEERRRRRKSRVTLSLSLSSCFVQNTTCIGTLDTLLCCAIRSASA